jgi:RNA polymerase sigma-70 factor (ECF subfamily)
VTGSTEEDAIRGAIAAARDGDVSGLWQAADTLRPYLRAVAAAILGGRLRGKVDASDVVQQALLASVERFEQFRGESPAEWQRWLVAIVRNEARNLLRYWHQDRRHVRAEDPVMGSRADGGAPDARSIRIPHLAPTPSHQLAARQEASRLLEVLDRLPPDQREVLRLRHFEGLSHAEIAERLGKPADAVRQTWVRALRGLKHRLEP